MGGGGGGETYSDRDRQRQRLRLILPLPLCTYWHLPVRCYLLQIKAHCVLVTQDTLGRGLRRLRVGGKDREGEGKWGGGGVGVGGETYRDRIDKDKE